MNVGDWCTFSRSKAYLPLNSLSLHCLAANGDMFCLTLIICFTSCVHSQECVCAGRPVLRILTKLSEVAQYQVDIEQGRLFSCQVNSIERSSHGTPDLTTLNTSRLDVRDLPLQTPGMSLTCRVQFS